MSSNPFSRPTLSEVATALRAASEVQRPDGDNHHLPLNHSNILDRLSDGDRIIVELAEELAREYVRDSVGDPNRRCINALSTRGFVAYLGPDQEDPLRQVGGVKLPNGNLDVSDHSNNDQAD